MWHEYSYLFEKVSVGDDFQLFQDQVNATLDEKLLVGFQGLVQPQQVALLHSCNHFLELKVKKTLLIWHLSFILVSITVECSSNRQCTLPSDMQSYILFEWVTYNGHGRPLGRSRSEKCYIRNSYTFVISASCPFRWCHSWLLYRLPPNHSIKVTMTSFVVGNFAVKRHFFFPRNLVLKQALFLKNCICNCKAKALRFYVLL